MSTGLSALRFYRIRRRLRSVREMLIALRNDVQSMDGDTGELLDIAQKHFAQIQEYWESKNIWKRFRGASQ